MASTEVDHPSVDTGWVREPVEAPSARFGWHGFGRKTGSIAGWFVVIALLGMLIGNHTGKVEDIFLVATAAVIAFLLIRNTVSPGRSKSA
ncbi:hypothetical protein GOARA_063_01330 [Gordonia araii NBRC 100433]|uniref:DUF2631 domain-containing protein n=1 Tax=Gordonia araii NBRC 100433 TaxID=1073574 RepID=G7H509_9ACTN|nr:DUF2631 domain-containing protein [Gordonia araii]NNG96624.1 DUF2631 domain-containing protein [Gordonia araii NBRC 100433]GAB10934.1 hypothetical protein GOARA_063_01330 [Gordonia araii NBRC 100433]